MLYFIRIERRFTSWVQFYIINKYWNNSIRFNAAHQKLYEPEKKMLPDFWIKGRTVFQKKPEGYLSPL